MKLNINYYRWMLSVIDNLKHNTVLSNTPIKLQIKISSQLNAFAYMNNDNVKLITVNTGLIKHLSKPEMESALAHEIGHLITFQKYPSLLSNLEHQEDIIKSNNLKRNLILSYLNVFENSKNSLIVNCKVFALIFSLSCIGYYALFHPLFALCILVCLITLLVRLLMYIIKPDAEKIRFHKLMRHFEYEADDISAKLTTPFDTVCMLSKLNSSSAMLKKSSLKYSNHPNLDSRINNIRNMVN